MKKQLIFILPLVALCSSALSSKGPYHKMPSGQRAEMEGWMKGALETKKGTCLKYLCNMLQDVHTGNTGLSTIAEIEASIRHVTRNCEDTGGISHYEGEMMRDSKMTKDCLFFLYLAKNDIWPEWPDKYAT